MADYDLVVLGSGPGGYVAAIRAAQLGLKVAIVERENLGGICLNWGCIPTKALLRSAEIYHYMQHAGDYGLTAESIGADIDAVVKRSRGVAKQLNQGVTHLMKKNKITVHMGDGKLTAASTLSVTKDGKTGNINLAWFICFAPAEKPEIAMAVVVVGDTIGEDFYGGTNAGPIASAILKKYFEKKNAPTRPLLLPRKAL